MHAIIAGCNKAGTTSLFRYLADHPQISPSRKKETDFFLADIGSDVGRARASYDALFVPRDGASLRLEASPAYLRGGRAVAERIARIIPDASLLFVLREPASRLISYLRVNRQNLYKEEVAALDHESYVRLVEQVAAGADAPSTPSPMRNALLQFQGGCYARYLREYLEYFEAKRMQILFFDDLSSNERQFMRGVCRLLDIDLDFYGDYLFGVENRTGDHRFLSLYRTMSRLNKHLEPWLNGRPTLRKGLRSIYRSINERSLDGERGDQFDVDLTRRLRAVYQSHNESLRTLLAERYPQTRLPAWLDSGPAN